MDKQFQRACDLRTIGSLAGRRFTAGWILLAMLMLILGVPGCAAPQKAPESVELVWPLPPDPPRIKFIRSVRFRKDVEESAGSEEILNVLLGKPENLGEMLKKPYGVHADREGRIFVADTGWGKVAVFDFANKKFSFWGTGGQGLLTKPVGVTSDSLGRVYVSDAVAQRVVVFDQDGNFLQAMGQEGELERPVGLVVNEQIGRLYVIDSKKHHIAVFDIADGSLVSTIGERGPAPGQFNWPTNIAIDTSGTLYVMDTMNFRVQILDPDGEVLNTFGEIGDGIGQFARPKGIAVDSEGNIYVVDAAFNNFQIFDPEGQLLLFVGSNGQQSGQFWLPAGAYIDAQDRIYVADQYNFRVQVFQRLTEESPASMEVEPEPSATETPEEESS
jgi:sugar lactone lactonase YvrE